ncbi:hypothetical protein GCM10010276_75860 [Streptomyces longisporus]|uniref:Uncharacterized protein n=1 Tax=Streptomyces longisporus TaxID=1948 RepID=A0ABN3N896_STRLO
MLVSLSLGDGSRKDRRPGTGECPDNDHARFAGGLRITQRSGQVCISEPPSGLIRVPARIPGARSTNAGITPTRSSLRLRQSHPDLSGTKRRRSADALPAG